ncbi:kinase-like protein [Clavulina sp. PMI_390]|nr:kinase-like protein [Clavulina sp. PMI_390]
MSGHLRNGYGMRENDVKRPISFIRTPIQAPSPTTAAGPITLEARLYTRRMQLSGFITSPSEPTPSQLTELNTEFHRPIPVVTDPLYNPRPPQPLPPQQLLNSPNNEALNDENSDSDSASDSPGPNFSSLKHVSLLTQLGVPSQHHLSMLTVHKATALLDQLYTYLRSRPTDSDEYAEALRLLQDLSHHLGAIPSAFELTGVTFDRRDVVGRGGEAIVYHGQMVGRKVVVREVPMSTVEWKRPRGRRIIRLMHREAITHSQLDHPNILPFLGVSHEAPNSPPIVVLPFCDGGSLHDVLTDGFLMEAGRFSRIAVGVTRGVAYLHSRNPPIIHGDIHPGNVLLEKGGNVYLCDFGFSRIRHEVTRTHTNIKEGGKVRFLAPELSSGSWEKFRTSKESDIFGLAMTLLNTWTGKKPLREMNKNKVQSYFIAKGRPERPTSTVALGSQANTEFWDLLVGMWEHEPKKRPMSNYVLNRLEIIFHSVLLRIAPSQNSLQYHPLEAAMASLRLNSGVTNTTFEAPQRMPHSGTIAKTPEEHYAFHAIPLQQASQLMGEHSRSEYPTRPAGVPMGAAFLGTSPRLDLNGPSVPQYDVLPAFNHYNLINF